MTHELTEENAKLRAEVEKLRAECRTLQLWCEEAAHAENLNADDARAERAAVVAFLRGDPEWPSCVACRDAQLYAHADAIERGEHRDGQLRSERGSSAQSERALIIAHLRRDYLMRDAAPAWYFADIIERGDHHWKAKP